jgi:hypothetical protein
LAGVGPVGGELLIGDGVLGTRHEGPSDLRVSIQGGLSLKLNLGKW